MQCVKRLPVANGLRYGLGMSKRVLATTLPPFLVSLRKRAGLTQTQLAEKMGYEQPFISQLERGASDINGEQLAAWCRACGYRLHLGPSAEGAPVVSAASEPLPDPLLLRIVDLWPMLGDRDRKVLEAMFPPQ